MTYRRLSVEEVKDVFALIIKRVDWMNAHGLRSWNTTNYLERYPLTYYEEMAGAGSLYGLTGEDGDILSAGVLLQKDERWEDGAEAIYLHNFVSSMTAPGAGSVFLEETEKHAAGLGISIIRLDVAENNDIMNRYYESRGYLISGTCTDGPYHGILREKKITLFRADSLK